MSDYNTAPIVCEKKETAKDVIEHTNALLRDSIAAVAQISRAVYKGPELPKDDGATQEKPTLIDELRWQRETAEKLLQEIISIKEVLW